MGTRLSQLASLAAGGIAGTDLVHVVDVSDTSMASTGTNKKSTVAAFLTPPNDSIPLGGASNRWSNVYSVLLNVSGASTLTGAVSAGSTLTVASNITQTAGTAALQAITGTTLTLSGDALAGSVSLPTPGAPTAGFHWARGTTGSDDHMLIGYNTTLAAAGEPMAAFGIESNFNDGTDDIMEMYGEFRKDGVNSRPFFAAYRRSDGKIKQLNLKAETITIGLHSTFASQVSFTNGVIELSESYIIQTAASGNYDLTLATGGTGVIYLNAPVAINTSQTAGAVDGDLVLPNARALRAVNAAGTNTFAMIGLSSGNRVQLGGGWAGSLAPELIGVAAGDLPAGDASQNGLYCIENTNHRFVYYSGGNRYYLAGTPF